MIITHHTELLLNWTASLIFYHVHTLSALQNRNKWGIWAPAKRNVCTAAGHMTKGGHEALTLLHQLEEHHCHLWLTTEEEVYPKQVYSEERHWCYSLVSLQRTEISPQVNLGLFYLLRMALLDAYVYSGSGWRHFQVRFKIIGLLSK